ncbi:MAG: glycosyltransferase family 4 protein [Cognatishimia sp.]|uniref:glycosyltransferase family 4 protein n=1 Tax=Cognatishimia sp. TaxID=2211648 RepID=UPI003B8B6025
MTEQTPLKIAYLCDMDPHLSWTYSGGNQRIFKALQDHVGEVTYLDPSWGMAEPVRKLIHKLPESLNLRLRWRAHYLFSGLIAKNVKRQLRNGNYDAVFGVYSLNAMASLRVPDMMVRAFTSDATQSSYRASEIGAGFGSFFKPARLLDRWVKAHETRCLQANDLNFWPSDWQKKQADQTYALRDATSQVVPWGANISTPERDTLNLDLPMQSEVRLLLVGRDWFAKGGPFVLEVLQRLLDLGVNARLSVIGTMPPPHDLGDHVDVYPNLDKSKPEDLATFEGLFKTSHLMVQPSLESFGFAFCEASAFALPSLCLNRGGIPVWDGINGHALPVGSTPQEFAELIQTYLKAPEEYQSLRHSARRCFEDKLNWQAWGREVKRQLLVARAEKHGASTI